MFLAIQLAVLELKIFRLWISWIIPGNLFENIMFDCQNRFEDVFYHTSNKDSAALINK